MKKYIELIQSTFSEWREDKASRLAAALSYYTTFSLAPLLVLLISLLGVLGIEQRARNLILAQVQDLAGESGAALVEEMIATAQNTGTGTIATIVGAVTLAIAALGVFAALQDALNTIWDVKPRPAEGMLETVKSLVFKRLLSFAMILVIGFLLLVFLFVSAGVSALSDIIGNAIPVPTLVLQVTDFLVSFLVITLLFAMIYKFLPDAHISWRDVWLGAAITALLFTLGKFAVGYYLGRSQIGNAFGTAGSLAILLVWVYYSAMIFFFGAEFTQVYANQYGSRIVPEEDAMWVTEAERANQGIPRRTRRKERDRLASGSIARALQARQRARMQPASQEQAGSLLSKVFFGILLITQFIPSIRSLYASKAE